MRIAGAAVLCALVAAPGGAFADDDPSTIVSALTVTAKAATPLSGQAVVATPGKSTQVDGLEVSPPKRCLEPRSPPEKDVPAPKLISTYPAKGEVVRPGLLVVRLTFDLPMACRGSLGTAGFAPNPCSRDGSQTWTLSYDRLNLRVLCVIQPGRRYTLWVNSGSPEDFQGLGGRKPPSSGLTFTASNETPVATVQEAVGQDPRLAPAVKP